MSNKLLTISEAAERLGRSARTLRSWEQKGMLPAHLYPERDGRGERRYSEELVEHIREWAMAENLRSGGNIAEARAMRTVATA